MSLKNLIKKTLFFIILLIHQAALAEDKKISLDFQNITIQDAIHLIARSLHQNIVISPHVNGMVTLHLNDMPKEEALDVILVSHHLVKHKMGNTWYIATRSEYAEHQQDEAVFLETHIWQIHYAKAEDIARVIQDNNNTLLSKQGHVRVDARTNSVCVQDTAERLSEVQHVVNRLDVPVQQVLIEARLASVDNDYERELGIHFAVDSAVTHTISQEQKASPKHFSLAIARLADGSQLDVQLAALENEGHGELISSPSLFTANQKTALIESGEEIPYQEVSLSGGTAVVFKKAVLSLRVTPQIMPDNTVLLQLQVNQDRPSNRIVLGVPAISTRQIRTNVLVNNGQTLVLGGIYESNQENAEQGIPFLSKIPLVGLLFKQQNVRENKRELLIFVTPTIMSEKCKVGNGTSKA